MVTRKQVRIGLFATVTTLIGTAAALKSLAAPAAAPAPVPTASASGGSTAVAGSNNATIAGSGNNLLNGSVSGAGSGIGNTVNVQRGALTTIVKMPTEMLFGSDPAVAKQLHGQWESGYSFPSKLGTNDVRGTVTYLRNGSYNFQGSETAHTRSRGIDVAIEWSVFDAGRWIARGGFLTVESGGMKSHIQSISIDGKPVDLAALVALGLPQPKLEDYFPSGVGTDFKLVSVSAAELHLEALTATRGAFTVVAKRQASTG